MKNGLLTFAMTLQLIVLNNERLFTQTQPMFQPGEYYLRGVMEVASGFRFNEDHTFDFFFSYGALDRVGKGAWEQQGDSLILTSPPKPEKDFILVKAEHRPKPGIVIQISDTNEMVLSYVYCKVQTPQGEMEGESDNRGAIRFEATGISTISLIHQIWPDRFSVFPIDDPTLNYFEFTIDPRIVEVAFNNLVIYLDGENLRGHHPLMMGDDFRYER